MTATMEKVVPATLAFARGLFTRGTDAFGVDEISQALKLSLADNFKLSGDEVIPSIPFTEVELTRARELNQYLILQMDKTTDGTPITMKRLSTHFEGKLGDGKLLYAVDWYPKEPFYTEDTPRLGWHLVSREVIPGSVNEDYIGQTRAIATYLTDSVYAGEELPEAYKAAVQEFNEREDKLTKLRATDWKKCAEELAGLKLNQWFREKPVEVLYGLIVQHEINHERLLGNMYAWTQQRSSDGNLVDVGYCGSDGVSVRSGYPDFSDSYLGVRFFRSAVPDLEL
jgi:hypothetical protein